MRYIVFLYRIAMIRIVWAMASIPIQHDYKSVIRAIVVFIFLNRTFSNGKIAI